MNMSGASFFSYLSMSMTNIVFWIIVTVHTPKVHIAYNTATTWLLHIFQYNSTHVYSIINLIVMYIDDLLTKHRRQIGIIVFVYK